MKPGISNQLFRHAGLSFNETHRDLGCVWLRTLLKSNELVVNLLHDQRWRTLVKVGRTDCSSAADHFPRRIRSSSRLSQAFKAVRGS